MDTVSKASNSLPIQAGNSLEPTDSELLFDFVVNRNESAFENLVRKHSAMVLGVCRQILCDSHEAEDAFQATFLVLASKGRTIHKSASLAAWLHRVAFRTAMRAAKRRQLRPQAMLEETAVDDNVWDHITRRETQTILNEELARLPQRYRAAVVLCHLQEKSREEAAEAMECSTGAVKALLARGRQKLRMRLARRGVLLAAALGLAATTTQNAAAATLDSLTALTSEAVSMAVLKNNFEMLSTNVEALARKGMTAMNLAMPLRIGVFAAVTILFGSSLVWRTLFAGGDLTAAADIQSSEPAIIAIDLPRVAPEESPPNDEPVIRAVAANDTPAAGPADDAGEEPQSESALLIASLQAKIEAMKLTIEAKAVTNKLELAKLDRLAKHEGVISNAPAQRHITDLMGRAEGHRLRGELLDLQRQLLAIKQPSQAPTGAATATDAKPAPAGNAISTGDALMVEIVTGSELVLSRKVSVESSGSLPLGAMLGRVKVDGLTYIEAEAKIREHLKQFYGETSVQVTRP